MGRGPRPRPLRGPSFRAWELVYLAALALTLPTRLWVASAVVAVLLVAHVAVWRLSPCGVETARGRPCRWLVRGLLRSCDFHAGFKHTPPRPTLPAGAVLPRPLWRRPAGAGRPEEDPQPGGASSCALVLAPNTRDEWGHLARLPRRWAGDADDPRAGST